MEQFETRKLILERGIEINKNEDGKWYIGSPNNLINPDLFISKYKLRPIICVYEIRPDFEQSMLLPYTKQYSLSFDAKKILDIRHSLLITGQGEKLFEKANVFSDMKNIEYITGAAIYHCKSLAYQYTHIIHEDTKFSAIVKKKYDNYQFGNQEKTYYEFDALITVARRMYDTTRFILWKIFGEGEGLVDMPDSFKKLFEKCKSNMPEQLSMHLLNSWHKFGEKIQDYRDCILHFVPIGFNNSTAVMTEIEDNIWFTSLLIPDNPEVVKENTETHDNLRYTKKIDALTYSWEITTEIIDIALEIVNSSPV